MLTLTGFNLMTLFIALQIKYGITPLSPEFHDSVTLAINEYLTKLPSVTPMMRFEDALQLGALIEDKLRSDLTIQMYISLTTIALKAGISFGLMTYLGGLPQNNPNEAIQMILDIFVKT